MEVRPLKPMIHGSTFVAQQTLNRVSLAQEMARVVRGAMHSGKKWRNAVWLNAMYSGKRW